MCGLVGVALAPKRRKPSEIDGILEVFTTLLVKNEIRGRDASGVATVDRDGGHILVKRAVPPSTLVELPVYRLVLDSVSNQTSAILGHTRNPTRGSPFDPMNNQPLRRGFAIAAHNGTILNADRVAEILGYQKLCEVDSEILALAANESPSHAAFLRQVCWMTGSLAAAISRTDDPRRVQILRGNMPVAIHYHAEWRATFWTSLATHLVDVLGAARELPPMTGITLRDGRVVRRYPLVLGEEGGIRDGGARDWHRADRN